MSTKTTFKRIALVTVAALGFGLLSVAPSTAVTQSDTLAISATGNATSVSYGSTASTVLTQTFLGVAADTMTVTVSLVSSPTGNVIVPTLTAIAGTAVNGLPTVSGLVGTIFDSMTNSATTYTGVSAQWTLSLPGSGTMKAGTYVIKITPANVTAVPVLATQAAAITWTVTVGAEAAAAAADSTSYATLDAGDTVGTGSTNAVVVVPVSTSGSAVAVIRVLPLVDAATATGSTTLVATITGPGSIRNVTTAAQAAASGARSVTTTGNNGTFFVYVYGDNTPGTSTITLTMGTVVLTKTVKFYGAAASVTATLVTPVIAAGSTAATGVVTAVVKDAAGNPVPGASLWLISGTPTVFATATTAVVTSGSTGTASFNITGLTAGTSTVTIQNVAAGSTATYSSTPVSVRVGSDVASSVTMTLDKATYSQGEAAILTVTIKDAAGNNVANGTHAAFSVAPTSTRVVAGEALPGTSIVTSGSHLGVVTYKINVPTTSGAFTISGLGGEDLAAAQAELAISVTATVSQTAAEIANADAIAAAADAAAEATDAANAATDAANAAAEAADAATAAAQDAADAVSTLGTQVAELIDGLKAQIAAQKAAITALTNLVIKIQKKLKA
jgi:hypothetical protein